MDTMGSFTVIVKNTKEYGRNLTLYAAAVYEVKFLPYSVKMLAIGVTIS